VLLSDWARARESQVTPWLSCDRADADPVRFWASFIEAIRVVTPGFGADPADLLAINGHMSADVIASVANDATKLPTGSVIIVDDFHAAEAAVLRDMTHLVERWPAEIAQLVLSSRSDPQVRLHKLRIAGELCATPGESRDRWMSAVMRSPSSSSPRSSSSSHPRSPSSCWTPPSWAS
jgi:LuxR family maltose regulon positive regulatory protein